MSSEKAVLFFLSPAENVRSQQLDPADHLVEPGAEATKDCHDELKLYPLRNIRPVQVINASCTFLHYCRYSVILSKLNSSP